MPTNVVSTVRKPAYEVSDDRWLLVNINSDGYYRVNYDELNWNKLISQLERNHQVSILISYFITKGIFEIIIVVLKPKREQ